MQSPFTFLSFTQLAKKKTKAAIDGSWMDKQQLQQQQQKLNETKQKKKQKLCHYAI